MNWGFIFQNNSFWLVLIWCVTTFLFWSLYRKRYKDRSSFDFTIIGIILALLLHRLFHIIFFKSNYAESYWSLNPYIWIQGERIFLGSKPWIIFALFRGGFDFRILVISSLFTFTLISKIQQIPVTKLSNNVLKKLSMIYPIVLIASFFRKYWIGISTSFFLRIKYFGMDDLRIPVQLIELLSFFCVTSLVWFVSNKSKFVKQNAGYLRGIVILLLESIILKFLAYNIPIIVIHWLLGLSLCLLLMMIFSIISRRYKAKPNATKRKSVSSGRFTNFAFK